MLVLKSEKQLDVERFSRSSTYSTVVERWR